MNNTVMQEIGAFRRTFPGQLKNIIAALIIPVGLFFWFRDHNLFLAIPMTLLAPLCLQIPSLLYQKITWLHERFNLRLLKIYEYSLCLFLTLSTSGSAYLFYLKYQYDVLVHFIENFMFGFLVVLALNLLSIRKGKPVHTGRQAAWLIWAWGTGFGVAWEIYQWSFDSILGSKMAFDSFQTWLSDTLSDVSAGQLGIFLGTLFICLPFWTYLLRSIQRGETE